MVNPSPSRYRRMPDLVWRVTSDRVIVRHLDDSINPPSADLVAAAAVVWIAAEHPSSTVDLASETGLSSSEIETTIELLIAAGWLMESSL